MRGRDDCIESTIFSKHTIGFKVASEKNGVGAKEEQK